MILIKWVFHLFIGVVDPMPNILCQLMTSSPRPPDAPPLQTISISCNVNEKIMSFYSIAVYKTPKLLCPLSHHGHALKLLPIVGMAIRLAPNHEGEAT